MSKPLQSYHLRPWPPPEARPVGYPPSDPDDGRYWPMIGGIAFDPRDVAGRETLQRMETQRERYEDVT
jgi:hypothetical protein